MLFTKLLLSVLHNKGFVSKCKQKKVLAHFMVHYGGFPKTPCKELLSSSNFGRVNGRQGKRAGGRVGGGLGSERPPSVKALIIM